jgi:hypothetical protein
MAATVGPRGPRRGCRSSYRGSPRGTRVDPGGVCGAPPNECAQAAPLRGGRKRYAAHIGAHREGSWRVGARPTRRTCVPKAAKAGAAEKQGVTPPRVHALSPARRRPPKGRLSQRDNRGPDNAHRAGLHDLRREEHGSRGTAGAVPVRGLRESDADTSIPVTASTGPGGQSGRRCSGRWRSGCGVSRLWGSGSWCCPRGHCRRCNRLEIGVILPGPVATVLHVLSLPQAWITFLISVALLARSAIQRRVSPQLIDDFVELVAYAGALWGVRLLYMEAIKPGLDVQLSLPLMAVTAILAYVASRGVWRILSKSEELTEPTRASNPPSGSGPGQAAPSLAATAAAVSSSKIPPARTG